MPNLYLYNVIVSGFCWVNVIEDACHQLRLMQEEGLRPNEVLSQFSLVHMAGLVKLIGVVNRMNADSYSPDRCTYNTSLKSRCRSGRELDALSLVHKMSKRVFFPNRLAYENYSIIFVLVT